MTIYKFLFGLFLILLGSTQLSDGNFATDANQVAIKPAVVQIQPSTDTYPVVSVTDGDTFKVRIAGKTEVVRIVGMNTPETVDPRKAPECFGKEASNKLKLLLTGKTVELEMDATQSDRDRYGRLLRFAFLDGKDIGLQMIREGYAHESLYSSTPHRYRDAYVQAQKTAEAEKVGLWADDVCAATNIKDTATPKPATINTTSKSCNGPDLDCKDFSSHSEAQAFFTNCGWSAEVDPMNLDLVGVGDGIPCESLP